MVMVNTLALVVTCAQYELEVVMMFILRRTPIVMCIVPGLHFTVLYKTDTVLFFSVKKK